MDPPIPGPADPALAAAVAGRLAAGEGLPEVRDLLMAAAAVRPASGWEMARAVGAAVPGALDGREGGLYALLAELERHGRLESSWSPGTGGGPRRLYFVPGVTPADGSPGEAPRAQALAALDGPARARLHRAAREGSRGVPGLFEREAARAEILSHLEASAAAYGYLGLDGAGAARAALRDFGDPWKVRTDLGRVHRGRPIVVFPRTPGEWIRSYAIYDLVPLAVVLAGLLLVRWQVVQAYNIPTKSMEPTLHGEEDDPDFILVDKTAFHRREPERFEIVVFYPPPDAERLRDGQEPSAFVKRCVGLGGDNLDILGGDIHVDGRLARRPPEIEDAMMVPLYDLPRDLRDTASRARLRDPASVFFDESWKPQSGEWALRNGRIEARPGPDGEARLAFLRDLENIYLDSNGTVTDRRNQVAPAGDLEVRFLATAVLPGAVVGADLTEGTGDGQERHRLRVGPDGVTLSSGGRTWRSTTARFGAGGPLEVRLRNVDDRLTAWVDGEVVLRVELPPRASIPRDPAAGGVELVAEGGPVSFGGVRILRDIVYLRVGSDWPRRIPEGKLFMMGDNTGNSHDSRSFGPVDRSALIGYPFAVVFPPTRAKILK